METRFVELMAELFQLDEAEALDFGLYRVIRRHNRQVHAFLGEIVADKETKALQGGRLVELLDAAFETLGHEAQADDKFRLKDLEQQLGLKPGMTQDQRQAALVQAEGFPAIKGLVAEYRSRTETQGSQQTVQQDRAEVLNRLYQFFSRHYQDGDFIVERRYGKGGARYVKSTGEDTEFHWATADMYYIKSGDIFTDFPEGKKPRRGNYLGSAIHKKPVSDLLNKSRICSSLCQQFRCGKSRHGIISHK